MLSGALGDLIKVAVQLERKQQKVLDAFVVSMCEFRKRVSQENRCAFGRSLLAEVVAETSAHQGSVSGIWNRVWSVQSVFRGRWLRAGSECVSVSGVISGTCVSASAMSGFRSVSCVSGECAHLGTVGASAQ